MLSAKEANSGVFSSLFTAAASPAATRSERWLKEQLKRARREGVFTSTIELTPELAELLLGNNPDNRRLSAGKLIEYTRDIKAGAWQHNGETIIIADSGEMNDGQHRCAAVIEAGNSIVTEMTFGVPRNSRSTVDIGMKRTVGQHLAMLGYLDYNNLAHAGTLVLTYGRSGRFYEMASDKRPTPHEILEFVGAVDLTKSLVVGRGLKGKFHTSTGIFAALHHALSKLSQIDADRFFEDLKTGTNLSKGSPIYKLRELLLANKNSKKRFSQSDIGALTITAWNSYRNHRSLRSLALPESAQYPVPV